MNEEVGGRGYVLGEFVCIGKYLIVLICNFHLYNSMQVAYLMTTLLKYFLISKMKTLRWW